LTTPLALRCDILISRDGRLLPSWGERCFLEFFDDDLAFLAAHPVRRSNSEAIARRREFKDATRQRIRDIAASLDLSDEEIKPALKLKHHDIAEFTEKHVVNLDWLLGGGGQIFKTGKPR
jgi:hypothetical protein